MVEKGKFISIDGTDGSGKATQTKMLVDRLRGEGHDVLTISFPVYGSPTGAFVGAYLGKRQSAIALVERMFPGIEQKVIDAMNNHPEVKSPFSEGAVHVNPKVASLFYAADRLYNVGRVVDTIGSGGYVVTDRYVNANKGHQGGKIDDALERTKFYSWLEDLEHGMLGLPRPSIDLLLHMPTDVAVRLRQGRVGEADEHERDIEHLRQAEKAYLQLAEIYKLKVVSCAPQGNLRTPEEISDEVFSLVKNS